MQVSREEQTLSVNHWNEAPYCYAGVKRLRLTPSFTGDSFAKLKITIGNPEVSFVAKCYKHQYKFRPFLAIKFLAKCKGTNCPLALGKRRVLFFPKCSLSHPLSQVVLARGSDSLLPHPAWAVSCASRLC